MGHRFHPGQPEEAAGALDGVDDAEHLTQCGGIVRRSFQPDERGVQRAKAFLGFSQEIGEQVVHFGPRGNLGSEHAVSGPKIR